MCSHTLPPSRISGKYITVYGLPFRLIPPKSVIHAAASSRTQVHPHCWSLFGWWSICSLRVCAGTMAITPAALTTVPNCNIMPKLIHTRRFVAELPSGWVFILFCVLLRMTEGVGSAMYFTATFTLVPEFYPTKVSTVMVNYIMLTPSCLNLFSITCRDCLNLLVGWDLPWGRSLVESCINLVDLDCHFYQLEASFFSLLSPASSLSDPQVGFGIDLACN